MLKEVILEIGETIRIGEVTLRVRAIQGNDVRLEISAPDEVSVRTGCGEEPSAAH